MTDDTNWEAWRAATEQQWQRDAQQTQKRKPDPAGVVFAGVVTGYCIALAATVVIDIVWGPL